MRLVGDDGTVKKQGRHWEQRTGEQLPAGGFMQQAAVREGNVEFIRLRDGSKGMTRKWDEATGQYEYRLQILHTAAPELRCVCACDR